MKWCPFWMGDASGAVAPTVALSLFALIGAGGIAFDYARLASMDTELQNAADQAALAAATQLDRAVGACARAANAANGMVANRTLFANDGGGSAVTVFVNGIDDTTCDATGNIRFYQDKAKTLEADADANARFVEVWVNGRVANYALTPVVAAFNSGTIAAAAYAGMGSAICKVPPFFMCPPAGVGTDPDNWKGYGLRLFQGSGNSYAPGNFGYLNVGAANNGTPDQRIALGFNGAALQCLGENSAEVDTGVAATVMDAINVRFDIFSNGWARNTCLPSGNCSSAFNSTKDVFRRTAPNATNCSIANGNNEWRLPPDDDQYVAQNSSGDDSNVKLMGYPMDICHYPLGGGCPNGRLGNGSWRPDLYFKANHPALSDATGSNWQVQTGLPANATRFEFYNWEQANNGANLPNASANFTGVSGGAFFQRGAAVCKTPGLSSGPNQPDRRVIAMAVATNCPQLNGSQFPAQIGAWAEVFLVQPSTSRPASGVLDTEIYVEIIGEAEPSGDGSNAQLIRRDVPYLIE